MAWELTHGPIPPGMWVLHRCDNPPCVKTEPDARWPEGHLFLGTPADNMADRDAKGRNAKGDRHPSRLHPELRPRGTHNGNSRITEDTVREIRRLRANGLMLGEIAASTGTCLSNVHLIVQGKTWAHVI